MSKRLRSFTSARAPSRPERPEAPSPRRPAPLGDAARGAAFSAVARQAKLYPDFDLAIMDRTIAAEGEGLSPLDAAFAYALYDAVARRWLTLEYLLQRSLTKPIADLEPRLRASLLAGAAQMLFLDRVPVHAAINHAVEWAKILVRPGAGAMTNAVLRKVAALVPPEESRRRERYTGLRDELPAPDGSAIVLTEACLPEDAAERLAVATSHPRPLVDHWLRTESGADVRALCLHSLATPPVVINTAHAQSSIVAEIKPHELPGHAVFTGNAASLGGLLGSRTDIWVQDAASSRAVASVADLRPRVVLDLCAGQGTKTRQLAATFPNAEIVAYDLDERRLETLRRVFAGSAQVRILGLDEIRRDYGAGADLILLDVPCSNTGVLARRPEARYRFDKAHLDSLVSLQKQIIADSIPLLSERPRGRILYSTCSLESEENQKQAAWADRWHGLRVSREHRSLPRGLPGGPVTSYADGAYSALLGES